MLVVRYSSRGGLFMSMQIFMSAHFVHRPFVDARVEPRLQQLEAVFAPPTSSKIARIEDERAHNVPGAVLAALCAEELGRRTLTG